ncbi:HNH endonuclease [Paradesulfitobacterium ferrireducens]|uniref:HNH endonuclease n=1 Tax=Paradesulfitobacterium ferrireducens TaxID=2816476 RepID=UPI001A8DFCF5|nr:HNH endonuclease [Paradesulfitobacterium ferrireducens]
MKRNTNQYVLEEKVSKLILRDGTISLVPTDAIEILKQYTWCREGTGYLMSRTHGKTVKIHRLLMNPKSDEYVDHKNGNPLDNRYENLRECRKQQNDFNAKIRSDNTSGYRGVSFHSPTRKWRAVINFNHRQYSLGLFENASDAAKAYNRAAAELFGDFARLNVI